MNLANLKTWLSQYLNVRTPVARLPTDSAVVVDGKKAKSSFSMVEILVRNPVQPT
jgi:hypothetical protein